jgi:hypothetical protein
MPRRADRPAGQTLAVVAVPNRQDSVGENDPSKPRIERDAKGELIDPPEKPRP